MIKDQYAVTATSFSINFHELVLLRNALQDYNATIIASDNKLNLFNSELLDQMEMFVNDQVNEMYEIPSKDSNE